MLVLSTHVPLLQLPLHRCVFLHVGLFDGLGHRLFIFDLSISIKLFVLKSVITENVLNEFLYMEELLSLPKNGNIIHTP